MSLKGTRSEIIYELSMLIEHFPQHLFVLSSNMSLRCPIGYKVSMAPLYSRSNIRSVDLGARDRFSNLLSRRHEHVCYSQDVLHPENVPSSITHASYGFLT